MLLLLLLVVVCVVACSAHFNVVRGCVLLLGRIAALAIDAYCMLQMS